MNKRCELCSRAARIFCHSDQASLCYDCDRNIHSANFLVAKHSRALLCHKCQSHTPWVASGLDLGRAASVCVNCLDENLSRRRLLDDEISRRGNDVVEENIVIHDRLDEEGDGETDDNDVECSDSDEDEENQVVPSSSVASAPTTASSSTSERFSSGGFSSDCFNRDKKRKRMDADLDSEDYTGCSSERSKGKATREPDDATSLYFQQH